MTVLKQADDKRPQLDALTRLLERRDLDPQTRKRIDDEIWAVRAGIQGEREAAYEIDFQFGGRDSYAVIHDLRLELGGRVAQIDHLLLNRLLDVWVCETKAFSQGVKIDERGEWYRYGGRFAHGMASPVKQNARHLEVLREVFAGGAIRLPRRLVTLKPNFYSVVLISNDARIDRPRTKKAQQAVEGLDSVIKIEQLVDTIERSFDRRPVTGLAKLVGISTVNDLGRQLVALHRPAQIDWPAKFGLASASRGASSSPSAAAAGRRPQCESCQRAITPKVAAFSRDHAAEFGGRTLCFDCQRAAKR